MDPITLSAIAKFLGNTAAAFGLDSFMGDGPQATPMTPEERELNDAAAKVKMALGMAEQASTGGIASEGLAPEAYLLDALNTVNALPDSGLEFFGDTKDKLLQTIQNVPSAIKKVPGALIEGTADLGNVIFQGATLGQGPQLEAVVPNLMDIINGGIGGTLVLGGGQTPTAVLGTGQTGIGRGTKVGVPNIPVIGPIINKVIGMHQQGATLGDIIKSIPSGLYDNLPQIFAGAAAAGLLFDEKDKETLVGLGVEPSILGGSDPAVTGAPAGTGTPVGADAADIITGASAATETNIRDIVAGGVDSAIPAIKTGARDIVAGGVSPDSPVIRTGARDIIAGGVSPDSPAIKTGLGPDASVIKTGPISDAELDKILTDIGGQPAVAGGYDTPPIKTSPPIKTGGGGGGGGGGSTPSGGTRTVSGGPGDLVDIDYLFDFTGGLDQPFLTTQEEEALKRLNIYAEGGTVKKFDAVDKIINLLNARY